jgi:hypothetical protein
MSVLEKISAKLLVLALIIGVVINAVVAIGASRARRDDVNRYDVILINERIEQVNAMLAARLDTLEQKVAAVDSATAATFGAISRSSTNDGSQNTPSFHEVSVGATVDTLQRDVHTLRDEVVGLQERARRQDIDRDLRAPR